MLGQGNGINVVQDNPAAATILSKAMPCTSRQSNYIMRGGHLFDLCKLCGWSDYKMVEDRYGHLAPEYLRDAVKRMNGVCGDVAGDAVHRGS